MKKFLAIFLFSALLTGCSRQTLPTTPDPGMTLPIFPDKETYYTDYDAGLVVGGNLSTNLAQNSTNALSFRELWSGAAGKDYTDPAHYTYNDFISGTTGMKWAPHTWETADDSYILGYTTTGFYDLVLNATGDGFTVVDEMALGLPRDVTQDYVGQFGITETDTARAWALTLNPLACWDNGEPITADTYLYSYQQLLDGKMMNRRADSVYAGEFAIVGAKDYLYGKTGWDNVGILKTGDYELVLITTAPVADPSFYVPYYLMNTYLVYEPLWESCKTFFDKDGNIVSRESDAIASVTTRYATSLDTSISYGPYKLTYFELDKQITLTRNENWYGYHDGRHLGQYQTDTISCQVIAGHSTALLAFLKGDLDSIALQSEDMADFAGSPYLRYQPQSYTTKLSFNTDAKALSARGAQVLHNVYFRQAFSLAIDRTRFAAAYTSAGEPGYGIINEMYIYDPYHGLSYRQSEGGKNALVQLYDLSDFGSPEEAYAAITGYDPEYARQLMQLAYNQCVKTGLYDGQSPITLTLSVYQAEDNLVQMFHFLQDALEKACLGTGFAGKVTLQMAVDADYYATMESGLTDLIFSTWGGSSYDPYGVLYRCYCDAGAAEFPNQMEYGFDSGNVDVRITIDGKVYEATLQTWARWAASDTAVQIDDLRPFREYDADTRCKLYADLEFAYLRQYVVTPLYYRNSARLISQKGDYPTQTYVDPVEFGGLRFYTYFYDDAAWQAEKSALKY